MAAVNMEILPNKDYNLRYFTIKDGEILSSLP
jgi:hypothetical protein